MLDTQNKMSDMALFQAGSGSEKCQALFKDLVRMRTNRDFEGFEDSLHRSNA